MAIKYEDYLKKLPEDEQRAVKEAGAKLITQWDEAQRSPMLLALLTQREQIQEDLMSILDGQDSEVIDNVCQVIVDRFQILIDKAKEKPPNS